MSSLDSLRISTICSKAKAKVMVVNRVMRSAREASTGFIAATSEQVRVVTVATPKYMA